MSTIRMRAAVFAAQFALLLTAYWSAVTTTFGVQDDYYLYQYDRTACCFNHPLAIDLLLIGRPLAALVTNVHLRYWAEIGDLRWGRLIVIVALAVFATLLTALLSRAPRLALAERATVSLLICLLPSAQIYVNWYSLGVLNVSAALFGLAGAAFLGSGMAQESGSRQKIRLALSGLCVMAGLFIYPPTTMCFILPAAAGLIFAERDQLRPALRLAVRDLSVLAVCCLALFASTVLIVQPLTRKIFHLGATVQSSTYGFRSASSLPEKASYVVEWLEPASGSLWFAQASILDQAGGDPSWLENAMPPSFHWQLLWLIVLGAGLAAWVLRHLVLQIAFRGRLAWAGLFVLVACIGATALPTLVAKQSVPLLRVVWPHAAVYVLLLWLAVRGLLELLPAFAARSRQRVASIAAAIATVPVLLLVNVCERILTDASVRDYERMKLSIASALEQEADYLILLNPYWNDKRNNPYFIDLGIGPALVAGAPQRALLELGRDPRKVQVVLKADWTPFFLTKHGAFSDPHDVGKSTPLVGTIDTVPPPVHGYDVASIFSVDGSPYSFVDFTLGNDKTPLVIVLHLVQAFDLHRYALTVPGVSNIVGAGVTDPGARLPVMARVSGSSDGKTLALLDAREKLGLSILQDERGFALRQPYRGRWLKFELWSDPSGHLRVYHIKLGDRDGRRPVGRPWKAAAKILAASP